MKNCDMCGSEIKDGKCSCGIWHKKNEAPDDWVVFRNALEEFHEQKRYTATMDAPHLGCAVVYFRGNYSDCKKVEAFIYKMHGRPYYQPE